MCTMLYLNCLVHSIYRLIYIYIDILYIIALVFLYANCLRVSRRFSLFVFALFKVIYMFLNILLLPCIRIAVSFLGVAVSNSMAMLPRAHLPFSNNTQFFYETFIMNCQFVCSCWKLARNSKKSKLNKTAEYLCTNCFMNGTAQHSTERFPISILHWNGFLPHIYIYKHKYVEIDWKRVP